MKKLFILVALATSASVFSASAEVLTPYTEHFENPVVRPKGWTRGGAYSYAAGTMTATETGGHSGGYISIDQYGNYWSSYYKNYNYNDLLVTPKVEGDVSIWVRKKGDEPSLTFFSIADPQEVPTSADKLTLLAGTEKNLVEGVTIDDWTQITVKEVPAGTYIGVRAHNLDIDEFSATTAEVLYRVGLTVEVENTNPKPNTELSADENNQVTFNLKVTVTNDGDVDFPASEPGMEVRLYNVPLDKTFATGYIPDAVPCGTTLTKEFSFTGTAEVDPSMVTNQYKVSISIDDNSVETTLGYFKIIPYLPVAKLMLNEGNDANQSSYNDVNILDMATIGAGPADETKRTLWLWNQGTATMKVTNITIGDGFSVDASAFELPAKEKKPITITLTGEPGLKIDTLRIFAEQIGEVKYALQGLVTKEGDYYEGFEGEKSPAGMVFDKNYKIVDAAESLQNLAGLKYAEYKSTSGSPARLITPKLSFEEGEKFHFMATKSDNISAKLCVYTSPDRVNWTLAKTIVASSYDTENEHFNTSMPTGTGYGTYEFRIFSIDMHAGNSYVAIDASGARVDNLHGGKLVAVNHDPYVVTLGLPTTAAVNTRYIVTTTLRNILEVTESDYDVVLTVNDEEVAHAAETPELAQGAEASFDLRFTPHTTGTFTGKLLFKAGGEAVELAKFDFEVAPEKAEASYQVGDIKITTPDPLNTFYNSQSQIIYRKASLGMDENVKITGFHFIGYNEKELTRNVKVWIENTDVDKFDSADIQPGDTTKMTLVYDGQYTFPVCGNEDAEEYEPDFVIPFNAPFTYTGSNLRIVVQQTMLNENDEPQHVFFVVDNSVYDIWNDVYDDRVIENKKEYAEDLNDEPSWSVYRAGFPVTYFNVAKDVVVMKGAVTNEFGDAVEGAKVVINSDDIQYSGVTDAEGNYSMNIANVDLTYTLDVEADDYTAIAETDLTFNPADEPVKVKDFLLTFIDRSASLSGVVSTSLEEKGPVAGAVVTLTMGEITASATTDELGAYTLTAPELSGEYELTVTKDDVNYLTDKHVFTSKADVKDLIIEYSSIREINAADLDANVVYDLQGRRVNRVSKGLYIINGVKTLVR